MKGVNFILIIWLGLPSIVSGQLLLQGQITTPNGQSLPGVNVFVKNTFDGTSADSSGQFRFHTSSPLPLTIVASMVGYRSAEKVVASGAEQPISISLRQTINELNAVVITAGSFEASETRQVTILKPMDILTTAGSSGDVTVALQTLPGAQRVGNAEGLFVRGGAAYETRTLIDGTLVEAPFFSSTPNVPQRIRFSPALFRGTSFSTGGFSAQYGQALSSVMTLTTRDLPDSSLTGVAVTLAGGSITDTRRWRKTSLSVDVPYANLGLMFRLVPQHITWLNVPETVGGSLTFRHQFSPRSLLKVFGYYNHAHLALAYQDINEVSMPIRYENRNDNVFINTSYQTNWQEGRWSLAGSSSYSHNQDELTLADQQPNRFQNRWQSRISITRVLGQFSTITTGGEIHLYQFADKLINTQQLAERYSAGFLEAQLYISARLAVRIGLRAEYSSLADQFNVSPRLSLAYKTGSFSQVSLAYGQFYQAPENRYRLLNQDLAFEQANHLIANYQYMRNRRTLRLEAYQKLYDNLVKEITPISFSQDYFRIPSGQLVNRGNGYARGIDLFLRDQQSIPNVDFWISYSLLDTKRDYQNFPVASMPTFASTHNINFVYKHYLTGLKSYVGMTYAWASGRPYYNPTNPQFLADRTPAYQDLSINWNYITRIRGHFMVVFASVSNLTGHQNIFGYQYSTDGSQRQAIGQVATRNYFLGTYISFPHRHQHL